jgi:uncharacterized protein
MDARATPGHTRIPPRIESLDVLRGVAILGIFYINIAIMGGPIEGLLSLSPDPAWSDRAASWVMGLLAMDQTMIGLLQLLFGAGVVLLTAKAASGSIRRNLWLLAIGLVHAVVLLWPYDILHIYAFAGLCLYPLRRIGPKTALLLALGVSLLVMASVPVEPPSLPQGQALAIDPAVAEQVARHGGYQATAQWSLRILSRLYEGLGLWWRFADSFATMLVGMALLRWGITQGLRSRRFYLALAVTAYAVGGPICLTGAFGLPVGWASAGLLITAKLAITIGHLGVINLLLQTGMGERLLRPFRAAGRTALSLYLMQTGIGMFVLFPAWGLGLWDRFSPAGLALIATAVVIGQILLANLWLRAFSLGPVEWAWRSLAAWRRQPLRLQVARP